MSWWGVIALAVYLAAGFVYNVAGKGLPLHPSSIPHRSSIPLLYSPQVICVCPRLHYRLLTLCPGAY